MLSCLRSPRHTTYLCQVCLPRTLVVALVNKFKVSRKGHTSRMIHCKSGPTFSLRDSSKATGRSKQQCRADALINEVVHEVGASLPNTGMDTHSNACRHHESPQNSQATCALAILCLPSQLKSNRGTHWHITCIGIHTRRTLVCHLISLVWLQRCKLLFFSLTLNLDLKYIS